MKYFFKNVCSAEMVEVEEYFNGLYYGLIENHPTARDVLASDYDTEEIADFDDSEKKELIEKFIESWYNEDTDFVGTYDEDGNEIPFEKLEIEHPDYFEILNRHEKEYTEKARKYYSCH